MKNKKLLALAMAGTMSLSLVLTACGGSTSSSTTTATPAETATPVESEAPAVEAGPFDLAVCLASEPQTIDPALNSAVDGAVMLQHAYEGLLKWGDSGVALNSKNNMSKAELVNGQAESYEKTVNDDGTVTYTFTLRDDIYWSDGEPVTAGDFVYSWQRLANPLTAADYCYMIDMVVGYDVVNAGEADPSELGVSAPDDKTFVVELVNDAPYFLEICAFPAAFPVRQDIIEAYGDTWTTDDNASHNVSNGPWVLTEWVHDSYIKMEPNQYHYDAANLGPASITFQLMSDQNAMLAGFNSGSLDFIMDAPVDEIPSLLVSGQLDIAEYIGTYYVCYQTQQAPFDDPLVRQAFTLAIDSQYIVNNVTQTGEVPAAGFVPAGIYDADATGDDFRTVGGDYWEIPTTDEIYQANCDKARELLAEAGYPNGEGFPTGVVYLYNTNDAHEAIAEALQQMWKSELGISVTIQNQEWNAFLETRKNGDYDIARNGWIADYNDPCSFLDMWVTGGGNNDAQYSNPEYDALIAAAKATTDADERMDLFHQAEDIIIGQDWALGPLYFYTQMYMIDDSVSGAFYTPLGYFIFGYTTQG